MTALERLREQVEAVKVAQGSFTLPPELEPWGKMIVSSTRLARALCDPGTVEKLASALKRLPCRDTSGLPDAAELDGLRRREAIRAVLNALAEMAVGDE